MHHSLDEAGCPDVRTPAFVYDEARIQESLARFSCVREISGAKVLYAIKAQPHAGLLQIIEPQVAGFSVSSLFEARMAAEVLQGSGRTDHTRALHLTSPGLLGSELAELSQLCSHISFNSLEQCQRLAADAAAAVSLGVRINPRYSVLDDLRYDPCRPHSKLGVPIEQLHAAVESGMLGDRIDGILFHTHFNSQTTDPLVETLTRIEQAIGSHLRELTWINMGGGHTPPSLAQATVLGEVIRAFRDRYPLDVWLEPGNAIVGGAGTLVASVIDCFERDGQAVAILDTGVHHLPEVFEYQRSPRIREHRPEGAYPMLLAGSSCLAGDLFGEYRFDRPLSVGDRISINQVGAYSLIKASRFNGHNLPSLYLRRTDGSLRLLKSYDYSDYHRQWSV